VSVFGFYHKCYSNKKCEGGFDNSPTIFYILDMGASKKEYDKTIPVFGYQKKEMKEELERICFNKQKSKKK
jgi:hypothetical protein